MIARIQVRETSWGQLLSDYQTCIDTGTCSLPDDVQRLLRLGQVREIDAVNTADFITINVIGEKTEIETLYNYFPPVDTLGNWPWNFNGKVVFDAEYAGQHNDILATQPDHITYDQNGNPTGSTPAAFDDPNWVNVWAGQGDQDYIQRFAREFSREFGEEFA